VPEQVEPDKLQPYSDKAEQPELIAPLYVLQDNVAPAPLTVPLQVREDEPPDDEEPPEDEPPEDEPVQVHPAMVLQEVWDEE